MKIEDLQRSASLDLGVDVVPRLPWTGSGRRSGVAVAVEISGVLRRQSREERELGSVESTVRYVETAHESDHLELVVSAIAPVVL